MGLLGLLGMLFQHGCFFFVAMIRMAIFADLWLKLLWLDDPQPSKRGPFDVGKTAGWGLAESCRAVGVTRRRQGTVWWRSHWVPLMAEVVDGSFLWQCSTDLMGTITLVGGLEHECYFSIQLGMSSSQLTNSVIFQRGRLNHQPVYCSMIYKISLKYIMIQ